MARLPDELVERIKRDGPNCERSVRHDQSRARRTDELISLHRPKSFMLAESTHSKSRAPTEPRS